MEPNSLDADELLDYAGVAALTGLRASTLRQYRANGRMPAPDALPAPDRPRWRASTIRRWVAARPGRGAPGRPRRARESSENPAPRPSGTPEGSSTRPDRKDPRS